jgi:hypothetical protein
VEPVAVVGTESAPLNPELDQFARILDRKQTQENLIEEREKGRVRAYTQRKGKNCRNGNPRLRPKLPYSVLYVLVESIDHILAHGHGTSKLNDSRI